MPLKSYEEIRRDIKNRIYHPVYLLQGEEPYYIDLLGSLIENSVLDEGEKEFNQTIVYGRDCELSSLLSIVKRFPMMANYQVVIVREAQEIKALFPRGKSASEDGERQNEKESGSPFAAYLSQPLTSTVLVLCCKYKSIDKRSKLYKSIEKNGVVFEMKKLYDDKLPKWIETYLADKKTLIKPKAATLMADHLGNDLSRIANECDKLLINLKPGETIDVTHIEQQIGISKEFNSFELQRAIGRRDVLQCNRIVNYFRQNQKNNPIQMTMGLLYGYFSKLLLLHSLTDKSRQSVASALRVNPYFVDDYLEAARNYPAAKLLSIMSILREYDLKSKGVNNISTDGGELTRELVYKIIH